MTLSVKTVMLWSQGLTDCAERAKLVPTTKRRRVEMNNAMKVTVSAALAGGLAFGLTGCTDKPPADFAKACKQAGGKTMRENDFENLGMAPMAFDIGGPKPRPAAPKVYKAPKSSGGHKSTQNRKTSKGWNLGSGTGGHKAKKSKKHDDNEWVCVKNGTELFDED